MSLICHHKLQSPCYPRIQWLSLILLLSSETVEEVFECEGVVAQVGDSDSVTKLFGPHYEAGAGFRVAIVRSDSLQHFTRDKSRAQFLFRHSRALLRRYYQNFALLLGNILKLATTSDFLLSDNSLLFRISLLCDLDILNWVIPAGSTTSVLKLKVFV